MGQLPTARAVGPPGDLPLAGLVGESVADLEAQTQAETVTQQTRAGGGRCRVAA
jgi:hypothetical protein